MPDQVERDEWFTFEELGQRLGSLVWVEQRLFEILGRWSTVEPAPQAAVHFATASRHHGWHAEVLSGCLPTSPQLLEADLVVAPTAGWQNAVGTLSQLIDPAATSSRLRAVVKVINPWLVRETTSLIDLSRPVSDAVIMRWLRFVELDHYDDGGQVAEILASIASDTVRFDDHLLVHELDLS